MMRKLLYSFLFFIFLYTASFAQCSSYPTAYAPTQAGSEYIICFADNPATYNLNISSSEYALINVVRGFSYTFRLNSTWMNQSLSIYDDAAGNAYLGGALTNNAVTTLNFVATFSGRIRVLVTRGTNCSSPNAGTTTLTITQTALGNTQETQNEYGTNSWVGHVYNAGGGSPEPFSTANYAGYYTSPETINEGFGGDAVCFPVLSNGVARSSIYTEGFAVRYKMKTTKNGCYIITMTGDDGVRLYLNGTNVFDRWVEQSPTTYNNVLVRFDGDDDLIFDYYENGGGNVVGFSMVPFDANSNTITAPTTVNFCSNGDPAVINGSLQYINGDANTQNPQLNFQWQISTDGSAFTNITGATGRTYDPPAIANATSANIVRRFKRLVTLNPANVPDVNGVRSGCTYNESNIVTITTSPGVPVFPAGAISGTATQCPSLTGQIYSVAAAPNTLNYAWTVPTGWNITAGQGTTSITVTTGTAGQNGNIVVTPSNGCGDGSAKTLAVTTAASPTISSQPSTAGQTVCQNAAATALSVTAAAGSGSISNYRWYSNTTNSNTGGNLVATNTVNTYTPSTATAGTLYYYVVVTNSNNCSVTSAVSGAIVVNPVHTITAGTSQNVCERTAITPITMTLGGGATGATVTGLPPGVGSSLSGNTLTISGTPTVNGTYNYSVTTTGNSCTVATTAGTIIVGIGNNVVSFTNGTSGVVCTIPAENGTASFTAPTGTYFNTVSFASYGSPVGSCPNFQIDYICHSLNSQSVTESRLLGNSGTITFAASNGVFGDPCVNTVKRYYGTARYSEPICAGTIPGQIIGGAPTGAGNYAYTWQISTTSATTGFASAPGTNNGQNYTPTVAVNVDTWFRRVVTSNGSCPSTSAAVLIKVNPLPQGSLTANGPFCVTGAGQLTFTATAGTGPYTVVYNDGTTNRTATNVVSGNPFNTNPATVTSTTTYTLVSVMGANTCARTSGFTGGSATITINPLPQGSLTANGPFCATGTGRLTFTATAGTGLYTVVYNDGTANRTANNVTSGVSFPTFSNPVTSNTTYTLVSVTGANTCARTSGFTGASATITINPLPSTPTVNKTDISCGVSGSVTLSNLPSGSWTIHQTGEAAQDITGTTASRTITGLAAGSYSFTVENSNGCISASAPAIINDNTSSTTWNGSSWSNGLPDANKTVTISSASTQPFTGTPTNIAACSLIITSATDVIIPSGFTFTVTNSITSNGRLVFKNNSSLIQTTNAVNSGQIVYERETNVRRFDLTYWSMPVTKAGFTMGTFSPNTLFDKYFYWDAVNSGWRVDPSGTSVFMEVGKGYSIRAPQPFDITVPSLFTGIFTGVPNNGNIPIAVEADKWNLIGNPYPSAIDAYDLLGPGNNPQLGALYIWSNDSTPTTLPGTNTYRYASSDYIVYNRTGSIRLGTTTDGGFNGKIAAGQAFFAKPTGVSTVNFTNALRRGATDNTQFYKTANSGEAKNSHIWLNLTNSEGAFKQTLLGYVEDATNGIDISFDATTMSANTYVDFYSVNEAKKLTIQGRAIPFDNTDIVQLGYKTTIEGELTIGIDHVDGLFDNQEIYLEDKVTGKITDLRKENYTFTSAIGTSTTRFVLRYTNKTLGVDNPDELENSVLVSAKDQNVKITSSKEIIKEVNIYNVGAQLLYTKNKVNSSELNISNLHSSDQVILVKVTLENGYTLTKKVIFSNL